jgi:hypothetical protein
MKSCVKDLLLAPFLPSPPRCCCFPFVEAFFLAPPCASFASLRGRVSVVSWGSVHSFLCFGEALDFLSWCIQLLLFILEFFCVITGFFLALGYKVLLSCSFSAGKIVNQSLSLSLSCCRTRVSVYLNAAFSRAFGAESAVLEVCFVPGFC